MGSLGRGKGKAKARVKQINNVTNWSQPSPGLNWFNGISWEGGGQGEMGRCNRHQMGGEGNCAVWGSREGPGVGVGKSLCGNKVGGVVPVVGW